MSQTKPYIVFIPGDLADDLGQRRLDAIAQATGPTDVLFVVDGHSEFHARKVVRSPCKS